jgi:hypothetical protein
MKANMARLESRLYMAGLIFAIVVVILVNL